MYGKSVVKPPKGYNQRLFEACGIAAYMNTDGKIESGENIVRMITTMMDRENGLGAGFADESYRQVGAEILHDAKELYHQAEMIVKVKEPQESEYDFFHEGQILYTYLHLAAGKSLAEFLLRERSVLWAKRLSKKWMAACPALFP